MTLNLWMSELFFSSVMTLYLSPQTDSLFRYLLSSIILLHQFFISGLSISVCTHSFHCMLSLYIAFLSNIFILFYTILYTLYRC
jgi:hypothetical protein